MLISATFFWFERYMTAPDDRNSGTRGNGGQSGIASSIRSEETLQRVREGTSGATPTEIRSSGVGSAVAVPAGEGILHSQSQFRWSSLNGLVRFVSGVGVALGLYIMLASFLGWPAIPRYVDLATQRMNPDMLVVPNGEAKPGILTSRVRPASSSLEMLLLAQFGALLTGVSILASKEGSNS